MNLDQLLTREADALANIVTAQLEKLEPQAEHLSSQGKLLLERAFASFVAASRDPNEDALEVHDE